MAFFAALAPPAMAGGRFLIQRYGPTVAGWGAKGLQVMRNKAKDALKGGAKTCTGDCEAAKKREEEEKKKEEQLKKMKDNPPDHPDYKEPKNWNGEKVRNPNGPGTGWPDRRGDVWVPDNHNGTHAPHWDVQTPGGSYRPVYPVGTPVS